MASLNLSKYFFLHCKKRFCFKLLFAKLKNAINKIDYFLCAPIKNVEKCSFIRQKITKFAAIVILIYNATFSFIAYNSLITI